MRKRKKKLINKKTYKLIVFILTVLFSGFFVKESVKKEYVQPVIGIVSGTVTKVNDGDTITIINSENKFIKIRLYGIDSPELKQSHGEISKKFLKEQISEKYITVDIINIDQYKRSVGRIFMNDLDINRMMIEEGYAWVYVRYCKIPERDEWLSLQNNAKAGKKGLWNKDNPVPPWEWRKES